MSYNAPNFAGSFCAASTSRRSPASTGFAFVAGLRAAMLPLLAITAIAAERLRFYFQIFSPAGRRLRQFPQHVCIRFSRALQHVERMIRRFDNVQRRQRPEICANWPQQLQIRQRVPGPLQKQHWNPHLRKVLSSLGTRFIWWMQWKSEKYQSFDAIN